MLLSCSCRNETVSLFRFDVSYIFLTLCVVPISRVVHEINIMHVEHATE